MTADAHVAALLKTAQSRRRRGLAGARAAAVVAALAGVGLLAVSGWFLTGAALAGAAGGLTLQAFNYLIPSAAIRSAAVLRTGGRYLERLLAHEAALGALAEVRVRLFGRLAARDPRQMSSLSNGATMAGLTSDVDALEDQVIRAPTRPAALAGGALAIALTLLAGPAPALVLAIGLAALLPLSAALSQRLVASAAVEAGARAARLKALVADQLAAAAEIAVYGLSDRVSQVVREDAQAMDEARRRMVRGEAWLSGLMVAAGPVLAAAVVLAAWAGGAKAPFAALAALAAAASVEALAGWTRARVRHAGVAAAQARLAVLGDETTPGPARVPKDGVLSIAGVQLLPGARLALIGPSGSGKTRILETLAGWRADAPQALLLGGAPVASVAFGALSAAFALAPQAPRLMAGSIADNLRLAAPGLSEAALWAALEIAMLAKDVRALASGLDAYVGEGAAQLSGGQRKRLALARALLARRPWLLLDEPTEGLDAATEAELVRRLHGWLDRTGTGLILASHRPAPLSLTSGQIALF